MLESNARAPRVIAPLSKRVRERLWSATKLPHTVSVIASLLLSASLMACAAGQALAQDFQFPPVAPDAVTGRNSPMPPYAPPATSHAGDSSRTNESCFSPSVHQPQQPPAILRPPIQSLTRLPDGTTSSALSQVGELAPSSNVASESVCGDGPLAPGGNAMPAIVRVALANNVSAAAIALPDGATLKDANSGRVLAELPPQSSWQVAVRAPGGYRQLCFAGKTSGSVRAQVMIAARNHYRNVGFVSGVAPTNLVALPVSRAPQFWLPLERNSEASSGERSYVLVPPSEGTIGLSGKLYRGSLVLRPTVESTPSATSSYAHNARNRCVNTTGTRIGSGISVINYLYVEDYLLSVVPSEMPSGWPLEALKAQAIAARSYVIANCGKHESEGYDVSATTQDQVYSGVASESDSSNRAVAETSGQVLKCNGNVITAYFHSGGGGYTETSENVWSKPLPFLKAVADYDDDSPHFSWTRKFNSNDAAQALARNGKGVGAVLAMMPVARGVSPRVRWLLVAGTDKTLYISGEQARKIFSLPSSLFNVGGANGTYVFAGRGFGHGLGLSQWGAKKLAELGYCAPQILTYYYKDITLERF